jgi:hypothetical protein
MSREAIAVLRNVTASLRLPTAEPRALLASWALWRFVASLVFLAVPGAVLPAVRLPRFILSAPPILLARVSIASVHTASLQRS